MTRRVIALAMTATLLMGLATTVGMGRASAATPAAHVASSTHTRPALLDKTRFLAHAGIAFFAIHHEYKRYKAGFFASGAPHRARHIIVAAAVLLIAYHEAKVAYGIAQKSHSKTLHALVMPFNALVTQIEAVRGRFVKGNASSADLESLNSATSTINHTSSSGGFGTIRDVSTPLPIGA